MCHRAGARKAAPRDTCLDRLKHAGTRLRSASRDGSARTGDPQDQVPHTSCTAGSGTRCDEFLEVVSDG